MKCPVCDDYDFEHRLDLEKHSLGVHGASSEQLAREPAGATNSPIQMKAVGKSTSREH